MEEERRLSHRRETDPEGCFERHHRWSDEIWSNELEPKIRNLVWSRVASAVVISAGAMIFIALAVVNAQDHIQTKEVEKKIEDLRIEVHRDLAEVKEDLQSNIQTIQASQIRMEEKINDILKMHIKMSNGDN